MGRPVERYAGLFQRGGRLFIEPYHETTAGVLVGAEPVEALELSASNQELGEAIIKTLSHSRQGIKHPTDWNKAPHPLYKVAGVKGWAEFVKGTLSCQIADDGRNLKMTPMRNSGSRSGFQFLNDLNIRIPTTAKASEIGAGARAALEKAE